ncbi:MAG: LuxR C-terminal-related transcriptional regulator [Legionella sp.]|uniref:LuxR C-terminal-related transcriptional regulator n=1 Tax=Legionella sp. TaxID=459 RepID=UPI00284A57B4|nr:LuxR C-terminal-related transcriptional regulator [Legionella sp.]
MMNFDSININNLPGLYVVLDLQSRFLSANQTTLSWTGFKSLDVMKGLSYGDMPCKASEQHENFVAQDQLILNQKNGYGKIIGLYCYHNDDWKVVLAEKYLLKNEASEAIALASYITDLTHTSAIDVTKFVDLVSFNAKKTRSIQQAGFLISENPQKNVLTMRQEECLFFLIRGKTCKEISERLVISIRTAESLVEQLKNIFICHTRSELVEKAIHNGYMSIIPKTLFQRY